MSQIIITRDMSEMRHPQLWEQGCLINKRRPCSLNAPDGIAAVFFSRQTFAISNGVNVQSCGY